MIAHDVRVLVLGSFPGAASLAAQQYYAHPRNQFWSILGMAWGLDLPSMPYAQRLQTMLTHHLGLWDVYASCVRPGSADHAIRQADPNDLPALLADLPALRAVLHNGAESARAMRQLAALGLPVHRLPSTSPAHASWSLQRKAQAWQAMLRQYGAA